MNFGFLEIDHLLGAVADPRAGGAQYERLGFTATPLSVIEPMGVGNRLVIFDPLSPNTANFVECMGIVHPQRVDRQMKELLSGAEGLRTMVLSTLNAQNSYERLLSAGYPFQPPRSLSRDWHLPNGEVLKPSFNVVLPINRPLGINFCDYVNLTPYLRAQFRTHTNTARHLTTVFILAPDPASVAASYGHMFDQAVESKAGNCIVGPGQVKLCAGTRETLQQLLPSDYLPAHCTAPAYVGFEVEVADMTACESVFKQNSVPYRNQSGALVTDTEFGCGNIIRFKPAMY